MSHNKRPIRVEFDESNQSFYVYLAVIWGYHADTHEHHSSIWHSAFTSLGAAQAFFAPHADPGINGGQWIIEEVNNERHWSLYLRPDNDLSGYCIVLHETLLLER